MWWVDRTFFYCLDYLLQVGSRLAGPFTKWQKYDEGRRVLILKELERMMNSDLTANTREIVSKCLKQKGGESKL